MRTWSVKKKNRRRNDKRQQMLSAHRHISVGQSDAIVVRAPYWTPLSDHGWKASTFPNEKYISFQAFEQWEEEKPFFHSSYLLCLAFVVRMRNSRVYGISLENACTRSTCDTCKKHRSACTQRKSHRRLNSLALGMRTQKKKSSKRPCVKFFLMLCVCVRILKCVATGSVVVMRNAYVNRRIIIKGVARRKYVCMCHDVFNKFIWNVE